MARHAQVLCPCLLRGRDCLRVGAGRKALGKLRKTVKLSPDAIRCFQAFAKRKRLPDFSAALEAASLKL